jgi:Prokaryotic homologs of the JAB domain
MEPRRIVFMEVRSADGRFGLVLSRYNLARLMVRCSRSWPHEKGGILVGHYTASLDTAVVTRLPATPLDSRSGSSSFLRGKRGLRQLLVQLWDRPPPYRRYYLGEWHYHPDQAPLPSGPDEAQMRQIAAASSYHCPEPLLLIVGGSSGVGWVLGAYVYPAGLSFVPLLPIPVGETR